jgi:hypothetical protein
MVIDSDSWGLGQRDFSRCPQDEEPKCSGGEAGRGGGLDEMSRGHKRETVRLRHERNFPHLVELALPKKGFRDVVQKIDAFHRERSIPVKRGRNRHEVKQVYIRFCFLNAAAADAFRYRFGGQYLTYAPDKPKSRTSV